MTYYVEPDYWVAGYAEGDSTGALVYGYGMVSATGSTLSGANYSAKPGTQVAAMSSVLAAGSFLQIYPGISLNSKSGTLAAGNIHAANSGLIQAQSVTKASGRIFWEMTSPASATWTTIVPQAEGTGE